MQRIEQILKERVNRKYRADWPFDAYYSKIERCDKLLDEIQKKIKSRHCIQEARKQYISAYITAFEVYFKDRLLSVLKILGSEKFIEHIKLKFDILELKKILENKISLEEFIVSYFNFQDLDQINKSFSIAFGIDFFEGLKNKIFKIPHSRLPPFKIHKKFYNELKEFIDLRHDFIHDINFKKNITQRELDKYGYIYSFFILGVDMFIEEKIEEFLKNIKKSTRNKKNS